MSDWFNHPTHGPEPPGAIFPSYGSRRLRRDLGPCISPRDSKKSFGNLKPKWRRQTNSQVAAHPQLEEQSNRRRQRRVLKVQQKTSVLRAFAAQHAVDPKDLAPLLHEQYEESGPEDNSEESKDAWKMRMAASCGITVTLRAVLAELNFVEVLVPEWRSDILSNIYHALQKYWFSTLNSREKKRITYVRAQETMRASARIPDVAPWDIGILLHPVPPRTHPDLIRPLPVYS
ncbi:hypothetical protein K438DRAFT_1771718, partial [Mycena galopus ATCC 62051]